jgi:hypothetical protein
MNILGKITVLLILAIGLGLCGCRSTGGNVGKLQSYPFKTTEAAWIRNGEPIDFEGDLWFPVDGVETLLDSEVEIVAEYRNIQVFVEKIDVRPFNRLYTKFGRNKFRFYEKP